MLASTDAGIFDSVKSFNEKIRASTKAFTIGIASFASTPFFTIAWRRSEICWGLVVPVAAAMPFDQPMYRTLCQRICVWIAFSTIRRSLLIVSAASFDSSLHLFCSRKTSQLSKYESTTVLILVTGASKSGVCCDWGSFVPLNGG